MAEADKHEKPGEAAPGRGATSDPAAQLERAARHLHDGGLVLAAGESGYLVLASATSMAGLEGLRSVGSQRVWLAPGATDAERAVALRRPAGTSQGGIGEAGTSLGIRLIRRLLGGPMVIGLALSEARLDNARRIIGVGPGAVDDDRVLWLRSAGPSRVRELMSRRMGPIAAAELLDGSGRVILEPREALARARAIGLDFEASEAGKREGAGIVLDGPASHRQPASMIEISAQGGLRIVREGVYEERFIRKQAALNVLFVCTGNTCRSPMAAAIAAGLAEARAGNGGGTGGSGAMINVSSAGVSASPGSPATTESVRAVRSLGMTMSPHGSRSLTSKMIEDADVVFAMTRPHLLAAMQLRADGPEKLQLLDPDGHDVPDPFGLTQETYDSTARRLCELISRRLEEHLP